jgi:hypothetical protein
MEESDEPDMDEFELTRRILAEPESDPNVLERVRERLREAIGAEGRGSRQPAWRRIAPVAAAFVALLVLLLAVVIPTGREAAATELRRMGRIASTQEQLIPAPGEFLLIRSEELRQEGFTFPVGSFERVTRLSVSMWVAPDRSGFREDVVISSTFASEADRRVWVAAGQPPLPLPRSHRFGPGEAAVLDVAGLPEEPDRLLAALRSGSVAERPPGDDQVLILIGELLAQGDAPPDVRAALFEVAARLEAVELARNVEDSLGRPGLGVSIAAPPGRTQLIFDGDSAQLLAIELYETDEQGTDRLASWVASRPTIIVEEPPPQLAA